MSFSFHFFIAFNYDEWCVNESQLHLVWKGDTEKNQFDYTNSVGMGNRPHFLFVSFDAFNQSQNVRNWRKSRSKQRYESIDKGDSKITGNPFCRAGIRKSSSLTVRFSTSYCRMITNCYLLFIPVAIDARFYQHTNSRSNGARVCVCESSNKKRLCVACVKQR